MVRLTVSRPRQSLARVAVAGSWSLGRPSARGALRSPTAPLASREIGGRGPGGVRRCPRRLRLVLPRCGASKRQRYAARSAAGAAAPVRKSGPACGGRRAGFAGPPVAGVCGPLALVVAAARTAPPTRQRSGAACRVPPSAALWPTVAGGLDAARSSAHGGDDYPCAACPAALPSCLGGV